jgi:ADP-dependent NAD(P)H-hydrate dehydratase / NAD(P)H-hydrate epimerase
MDMEALARQIHRPKKGSHKGQNGVLLVTGGSKIYAGAPILAIMAARRFCDLVYFLMAEKDDALRIAAKSIPEAIVVDSASFPHNADCVLFGNGMQKAPKGLEKTLENKRVVLDAGGFNFIKTGELDNRYVLTPHQGEFKRYFGLDANKKNAEKMAREYGCTILLKGEIDIITDGKSTVENTVHNAGMTKGGTGDVLAGLCAALYCKSPALASAAVAARINGLAGNMLMEKYGYNFCASDLADALPGAAKAVLKE